MAKSIPQKSESWKMFNRISHRYDLLNRLLSGRRDVAWRKTCVQQLPTDRPLTVVDLATGTADVILMLLKQRSNIKTVIGIDPAKKMLDIAARKVNPSTPAVQLLNGDAQHIALRPGSVDAVTMAFGIRNVANIQNAFAEMNRILTDDGELLILEFSLPKTRWIRMLYLFYFRHVLPNVGGWISGDREAYSYLNQTVEDFPYGEAFSNHLRDAGFEQVKELPLTLGIATIYHAKK